MSYQFIIQKDLPLISWALDDAFPRSGGSVESNGYATSFIGSNLSTNGRYDCNGYRKSVPFIHGSKQSVVIPSNGSSGYALQVPAMGFATSKYKYDPMTLEFWIKPIDNFATSSFSKLVGKPNSNTGIYVYKSSIVAIVGDTDENKTTIVVPQDNMSKPMHIAFVYSETSISLYVNGIGYSAKIKDGSISNEYSGISDPNDVFRFFYFGKKYAIDNIAIYAYEMSLLTARRHMAYGLGYDMPTSVAENFGGFRYNLSLSKTQIFNTIQKHNASTWMTDSDIDNMIIEKGKLRINSLMEPKIRSSKDTVVDDVFVWDSTYGLMISGDGGYIEIDPNYIDPMAKGFAVVMKKSSSQALSSTGDISTLFIVQDPLKNEYFLKVYLQKTSSGESVFYQLNNNSPVLLKAVSGGINSRFTVGYLYDLDTNMIDVFYSDQNNSQSISTTENLGTFPTSYTSVLRIGSNDSFSSADNISELDSDDIERFLGGLIKIVNISGEINESAIYTDINSRIDKYTATVDIDSTRKLYLEKRFLISAKGHVSFNIDAKSLSSPNGIIGANRCEWGSDSPEISIYASPLGSATEVEYDTYQDVSNAFESYEQIKDSIDFYSEIYGEFESTWMSRETLRNRKAIRNIVGKTEGVTKGLNIRMEVVCEDVVMNPTTIPYFRIFTLKTLSNGDSYSTIVNNGPDINITYNSTRNNIQLPDYRETPFFWTEEDGGMFITNTATIEYAQAPISGDDESSGIAGISFFINIPDKSSRTILNVSDGTQTETITFNGSTYVSTNSGTDIYVNGNTQISAGIYSGEWQHLTIVMGDRFIVGESSYPTITFGSTSQKSDFYIDEIMTLDGDADAGTTSITLEDANMVYKLYTGSYYYPVNVSTINEMIMVDKESATPARTDITDIDESRIIIQPILNQKRLLSDVSLASFGPSAATIETYGSNLRFKYTSVSDLVLDSTYIQSGDRILLKNQSNSAQNGLFLVSFADDMVKGESYVTLTRQSVLDGDVVYVKDGASNKGLYFVKSGTSWNETYVIKKVDAYTYEGSRERTDLIAKTFIDI